MFLAGRCYYALGRTRTGHTLLCTAVASLRRCGLLRSFHIPYDALHMDHAAVRELMRLWRRIHWDAGDMMPPEQLLAIYELAVTWPVDGDVVELGAWTGLTTCYLAAACRARQNGHVYAVDTFKGSREALDHYRSVERFGGDTLSAFQQRIAAAGVGGQVDVLVGLTSEMVHAYCGLAIRVLFIDADHSYEGVRRDFELWSPLVAPGGLIIFHDYVGAPGVTRFVDTQVISNGDYESAPGHVVENVFAVTKKAVHPRAVDRTSLLPLEPSRGQATVRVS